MNLPPAEDSGGVAVPGSVVSSCGVSAAGGRGVAAAVAGSDSGSVPYPEVWNLLRHFFADDPAAGYPHSVVSAPAVCPLMMAQVSVLTVWNQELRVSGQVVSSQKRRISDPSADRSLARKFSSFSSFSFCFCQTL